MSVGPATYLPPPPPPPPTYTYKPFLHLVQRMAELQKDTDGMESVEKLKGAHGPQLSTRCSKLTG